MPTIIRRRVQVLGRVQGVWFRDSARATATEHGLAGWAANLPDGSLEVVFEGTEDAVAAAVAWCRSGPPRARVESVTVTDEEPEGLSGFEMR